MNEFKPIRTTADRLPDNEIEALMMAKPFEEPAENNEDLMVLREAVAAIVDELDARDLWIINACISEGKSLQKIADELGMTKTHVWRLRNQAFEKLKGVMVTDTTIRKHIRMAETWEQSATQWVMFLASEPIIQKLNTNDLREIIDILAQRESEHNQSAFQTIARNAIDTMRFTETWDTGQMIATLCKKQNDYGHSNINRFGLYGVIVRLSDKIERLENLTSKKIKPQNETLQDTLTDIVGYCVIALMLMDETFNLQLGDDYGTATGHE